MSSTGKENRHDGHRSHKGPVVVLVTFSIVALIAAGILLFVLYGPEPPEEPAPPEARMLPTVLYPLGDGGTPPPQP